MKIRQRRRDGWISYRRLRQVLFAFASAGGGLGVVLLLLYLYKRQGVFLWLGAIYLMLAGVLAGICHILRYQDDLRHRLRYRTKEGNGVPHV